MTTTTTIHAEMRTIARDAQLASRAIASLSTATKNAAMHAIADALDAQTQALLYANAIDVQAAKDKGLAPALVDRLTLTPQRIADMAGAVREIAALPDPIGQITHGEVRPNGLQVQKVRIPLGVVLIIYEARPNVTTDAAALCLKSGNAVILRGGSEALNSNVALAAIVRAALADAGLGDVATKAVQVVSTPDREASKALLAMTGLVDLAIPRGGKGLINFVAEHARVPLIYHADGICHVFVDEHADIEKAASIVVNGKTQRPGVCNATETVLVHDAIAKAALPQIAAALHAKDVELRGCVRTRALLSDVPVTPATDADWNTEHLDLILNVRVVADLDGAIDHIQTHGSNHTDAIVTESYTNAQTFLQRVNSSCVVVNASTRFNDGGQLGLGAEMGISTCKLHAYGPMGLTELTAQKFVLRGQGHVRS